MSELINCQHPPLQSMYNSLRPLNADICLNEYKLLEVGATAPTSSSCGGLGGPFRPPAKWGNYFLQENPLTFD